MLSQAYREIILITFELSLVESNYREKLSVKFPNLNHEVDGY